MSPFLMATPSPEPTTPQESTPEFDKIKGGAPIAPSSLTFLRPDVLDRFQLSPREYMRQGKLRTDQLVAATIVTHDDKILLVQRSAHDFGGLCWEVPGGSCDDDDLSVMGAACRELWEEAGLRATAVVDFIDDVHLPSSDGLIWRKMTFLVDVDRTGAQEPDVKLDPEEHQAFLWATEEDLLANRHGDITLTWMSEDQRQTILKAFKMLKRPTVKI
ncbi:NUDIX hydrolase domain-like protein [Pestalotiopsis sp. NC0098]|nr:NUDIX hydrolase domain-like protein [Pestalotiopsis sp. NC0098]